LQEGAAGYESGAITSRLFRKIQMIDDATMDRDLRSPPSNHFERLRGHLDGLHSNILSELRRLKPERRVFAFATLEIPLVSRR